MKKIIEEIKMKGFVSEEIRNTNFKELDIFKIRDWLEANGFDRHLPIQLRSTEIAVITPDGIIMQVRSYDNNQLGMWGGALEPGETPIVGAIRELYEETGLNIDSKELEFVGIDPHTHEYANGDKAIFETYRYILNLQSIPELTLDTESNGYYLLNSQKEVNRVLLSQQSFISEILSK